MRSLEKHLDTQIFLHDEAAAGFRISPCKAKAESACNAQNVAFWGFWATKPSIAFTAL